MSGRIDREVGARLRAARRARGLSMQQVAESLGVSLQTVHKWETGKSGLSVRRLHQLRDNLGIGFGELLGAEIEELAAEDLEP